MTSAFDDPLLMDPAWTKVFDDAAMREGWSIWSCGGSEHGRRRLVEMDRADFLFALSEAVEQRLRDVERAR